MKNSTMLSILLISLILVIPNYVSAHVSLTFPPARKYNLDYLDNGAPPPCGMPKGSVKTSFVSGSSFNVTWHLGYPHQGTHRLELLSPNGTELYILASELDTHDPTAQRHEVTLPKDFVCKDCIIRLLRQSAELRNPYYWFRSCGDIDIVEKKDYIETCSGHGRARADGVCGCKSAFWGKRCQYEDECRKDDDCGGHGNKCIDLGGTTLPRKQCFCTSAFVGKKCATPNKVGVTPLPTIATLTDDFLIENYLNYPLDKRFHVFWRVIHGETMQIEFVLKVNGTSYAGLGWRPLDFQGDCTRYPITPETSRQTRRTRQIHDDDDDDVALPNNQTQVLATESRPPPPRPRGPHPMGCTDVVMGAARGNLSRILDYWSGDISTPREDSLWDGTEDIEAGTGWETPAGITTIIFRKKALGTDVLDGYNDWPLDEPVLAIWARGQEHGEYVHRLPAGVDKGQPASVPNYYVQDEIKYHGSLGQRGVFSIDFLGEFFPSKPVANQ